MPPASRPIPRARAAAARRVTLADVAKLAGVSTMTASRALAHPDVVSPETRKKVHDAVARTGYVPNLLAGALRSNRTRMVACLVPTIGSGSVFMDAVQAMTEVLEGAGYQVILGQRGYDVSQEERLVDAVLARRPDGLVLMGTVRSPAARRRLQANGAALVEAWDISGEPVDSMVGFSHRKVGAATARFLHERGRKRPALITTDEPRGAQRGQGFLETARRLGLVAKGEEIPTYRFAAPSRLRHGREGLAHLLAQQPGIDAIYCATDLVALGALTEARSRGIAVPGRLAIIGFGDADYAVDTDPPLTTVRVDSIALGRRVAELLMARIDGAAEAGQVLDLGFEIVERGTT
ncbi:MAG TPA: LacI family DNA-binding transcriptional regulator [Ramlibacter sp.]|uniref:LacI family DNA-binding transcriptional regulator n=1 Tax=Ramlibacter sp. TaxID=1917967 RepID=UPI002ED06109